MYKYSLQKIAIIKGRLNYAVKQLKSRIKEEIDVPEYLAQLLDVSTSLIETQIYIVLKKKGVYLNDSLNLTLINRLSQVDSEVKRRSEASGCRKYNEVVLRKIVEFNLLNLNLNMLYRISDEDISNAILPLTAKWEKIRDTFENGSILSKDEAVLGLFKQIKKKIEDKEVCLSEESCTRSDRTDIQKLYLYVVGPNSIRSMVLQAIDEELEAMELYMYYSQNGEVMPPVYVQPMKAMSFEEIAERSDVYSLSIACHAGNRFLSPYETLPVFKRILERGDIDVRIIINSPEVTESIVQYMEGEGALYPPLLKTFSEWVRISKVYPNTLQVRIAKIPLFHRLYIVKSKNVQTNKMHGVASVRYYAYGNSNNQLNPVCVYGTTDSDSMYKIYSNEFETLWDASVPIDQVSVGKE